MDFFRFFLILGSIFGCFPANLRFILGKSPLTQLRYHHYTLSVIFIALLFAQSVEILSHFERKYYSLKISEKMSLMIAVVTYAISDTYFRLCGIIYGHRLSLLIEDLRKIKGRFIEGFLGENLERKWFTFGTALGFLLQCVHVPLRVYEWYAYRITRTHEFSVLIFPENPLILYPIVFLVELGGMVCRSFALAIVIGVGLELLDLYKLLNISAEKFKEIQLENNSQIEFDEPKEEADKSLLTCKIESTSGNPASLSDEHLCNLFFEIKSCFYRFNNILGSYAFVYLVWTMSSLLLEIRELPSKDKTTAFGYTSVLANELAGIFGTIFGLVVTFLICLLGQRIELMVRLFDLNSV